MVKPGWWERVLQTRAFRAAEARVWRHKECIERLNLRIAEKEEVPHATSYHLQKVRSLLYTLYHCMVREIT